MDYNPEIHRRKSIRLRGYDYSQEGMYFVTICVQDRESLFGEMINGEMLLNEMGTIAYREWMHTPEIRKNVELDAFVVMPNHIHGIIIINNRTDSKGDGKDREDGKGELHSPRQSSYDHEKGVCDTPRQSPDDHENGVCDSPRQRLQSPSQTIGAIIRGYKSSVTKKICELLNTNGLVVWQRNYWEHIIRDDRSYIAISEYIINNPQKWDADKLK
jgi:putative transposase